MVIRREIVNAVLNDAEMRGINLDALKEELFTSRTHLAMVARHEVEVGMFYRERHRPVRKSSATVYAESKLGNVDAIPQFTEKQIEIAAAVLEKRKLK